MLLLEAVLGTIDMPMQDANRVQKIAYASQTMQKSLPKNFCSALFTQVFLSPKGEVPELLKLVRGNLHKEDPKVRIQLPEFEAQ